MEQKIEFIFLDVEYVSIIRTWIIHDFTKKVLLEIEI